MTCPDLVNIHRLVDLEASGYGGAELRRGIERIFRAAAARWPDDPAAAQAFQDLWLDQYLQHERELAYVAMAAGEVAGYLVGCRIDPAISTRFKALSYFQTFAAQCAAFPAHLHINVDAANRGRHIGEGLVETFCQQLEADGIAGVHVVTSRDQRNVGFYKRLGFVELAFTPRGGTEALFLARRLR